MEIDKNIILKLIKALEDLNKTLSDKNYKVSTITQDNQTQVLKSDEQKNSIKRFAWFRFSEFTVDIIFKLLHQTSNIFLLS